MKLNPENMRGALIDINAEFTLLRALTRAMFDQCPDKSEVIRGFRDGIESYVRNAPAGAGKETLVEVRVRGEVYLTELAASLKRRKRRRSAA